MSSCQFFPQGYFEDGSLFLFGWSASQVVLIATGKQESVYIKKKTIGKYNILITVYSTCFCSEFRQLKDT